MVLFVVDTDRLSPPYLTTLVVGCGRVIGEEKEMPIVPNTPGGACLPSNEARVIMTATPPYTVVRCNEAWTKLCGHNQVGADADAVTAGPVAVHNRSGIIIWDCTAV